MNNQISSSILNSFTSPNVLDSNGECANVVDVLHRLSVRVEGVANAITSDCLAGVDACGGHVHSLTESVMGITDGLCKIASSIDNLAEAIRGQR